MCVKIRGFRIKGYYVGLTIAAVLLIVSFIKISDLTNQLATNAKQSIESRVTTVEQRCWLTGLLLAQSEDAHWKQEPQFRLSLKMCEAQLANVKALSRKSPS